MPPRKFSTFVIIAALAVASLLILSSPSRQPEVLHGKLPTFEVPNLPTFEIPKLPTLRFSYQKSAHKPPEQKNSTRGDSSWLSDWRWLNPFSSSIALDEDRAVLPPSLERPPVYTYYVAPNGKDEKEIHAAEEILLTWRRAWWSHGFRPVVLTEAEALSNPLYRVLREKKLSGAMEKEFMRFLAWGHMGTGLLASWVCVPMGPYDDLLLSHLRRGQYEQLTRFDGLDEALFAGEQSQINDAIKEALNDEKLDSHTSITDAVDSAHFKVEQSISFANYDFPTIEVKYPALAAAILKDSKQGSITLNRLMNAHLHMIWQNTFSSGIAVLKPLPKHSTSLIKPSLDLAKLLAECPETILPSSCPPNRVRCNPCVTNRMIVTTPPAFKNVSTLYTISTVPHPYTMTTLNNETDQITVPFIRRHTDRDQWVAGVTRNILGDRRGGAVRIVGLKEIVASEYSRIRSLWFTTEQFPTSFNPPPPPPKSPTNDAHPIPEVIKPFPEDWLQTLDWFFGFSIPRSTISHGESLPPVPGPERWAKSPAGLPAERKKSSDPDPPTDQEVEIEVQLLRKARDTVKSRNEDVLKIRAAIEAWNMADTEAWKFVRAFRHRSVLEQEAYEEEESGFKGPGSVRGNTRWWGV